VASCTFTGSNDSIASEVLHYDDFEDLYGIRIPLSSFHVLRSAQWLELLIPSDYTVELSDEPSQPSKTYSSAALRSTTPFQITLHISWLSGYWGYEEWGGNCGMSVRRDATWVGWVGGLEIRSLHSMIRWSQAPLDRNNWWLAYKFSSEEWNSVTVHWFPCFIRQLIKPWYSRHSYQFRSRAFSIPRDRTHVQIKAVQKSLEFPDQSRQDIRLPGRQMRKWSMQSSEELEEISSSTAPWL
jgi:hypothetical protein